jgi:hypothetical protein
MPGVSNEVPSLTGNTVLIDRSLNRQLRAERNSKTCHILGAITAVLFSVVVAPGVNNMYFFTYCFAT